MTDRIVRLMNEFVTGRSLRFRYARFANTIIMHIFLIAHLVVQRYDEKKKKSVTLPFSLANSGY